MQKDTILRIPKCNAVQIEQCEDSLSKMKVIEWKNEKAEVKDELICSLGVPGACPRVRCKNKSGNYDACRMLSFIETQENQSGFWMRLPCQSCDEVRDLHEITKSFVYD